MSSETKSDGASPRVRVSFADLDDAPGGEDEKNNKDHPESPPPPPPASTDVSPKFASKELRSNLMREQTNRDPLFYYEVVTVLGVGSMGSVAKVRKRSEAVGGSARKHLQAHFQRERRLHYCLQIPVIGGVFQYCLQRAQSRDSERDILQSTSGNSTVILTKGAAVEDYNDGHGSLDGNGGKGQLRAMKSIHLSRVTDPSFIEELKNEVNILRSLDHPHIVRPIETFFHRNQLFIM